MKLWPLPQTVKIGAHTYTVDYPHHFEKGPNGKYHGMACPNQQLIQVDDLDNHGDPIHPLCSIVSLLHECVHEIDKLTGNHMFDDNTRTTEDKLDAFVEGLAAFLIDNGFLENTWDEALNGFSNLPRRDAYCPTCGWKLEPPSLSVDIEAEARTRREALALLRPQTEIKL